MKEIWNGQSVAESDDIMTVGYYQYFPRPAVKACFFRQFDQTFDCHSKGAAGYWDLEVNGETCFRLSGAKNFQPIL